MKKIMLVILSMFLFSCGGDDEVIGSNGSSAIMFSAAVSENISDLLSNDPNIPATFVWNEYYAITSPGTYTASYCGDCSTCDEYDCWADNYTTYFNEGLSGDIDGSDLCYELSFSYTGGLSFYEWTPDFCINTECSEFFNVTCDGSFFSEDEDYLREKLQYEEYLKINSSD